uniref:Putative secreted protein n=1 Tax=Ixodes ricinus TaxID=34613 RepID=A0A6B0UWD9_IXORI
MDATVAGHILLATLVEVHAASSTMDPLATESVQQGAAVVAERGPLVAVHHELVRDVDAQPAFRRHLIVSAALRAGAPGHYGFMAPLVDDARAHLTLVPLFPEAPDEPPAVGAEGGLPQEGGHELVAVDLVHPAAHGSVPPAEFLPPPRLSQCLRILR